MSEPITRRDLLTALPKAAALGGTVAALGVGAASLAGCSNDDSSDIDVLTVSDDDVTTLDSFTMIKKPGKYYTVRTIATLAEGSLLFSSDGKTAVVLAPGDTATSLTVLKMMDLSTGSLYTGLSKAVGSSDGFSIYEARTDSDLLVWVESNYLTGDWRVYSASVTRGRTKIKLGEPVLMDSGDSEYDAPELAVANGCAYWIVQPAESGSKTSEDSLLKTSTGAATPGTAYTSHGRFCGKLSVSDGTVCALPRADTSSNVYYQMTAFENGTVASQETLPHSFKPNTAIHLTGGFSFGINGSYDYGDGISHVGTYYPLGDGEYLRLTKEPVTPPGFCKGWFYCKSGGRTVFVNLDKKRYFTINPPSNAEDYGDYTVQQGDCNKLIVYSTVTSTVNGSRTRKVVVRKIRLKQI